MDTNYEDKLQNIIKEVGRIELDKRDINQIFQTDNLDLINDLGFDSFLMVQLVIDIEDKLGIEFDMETLDMENIRKYRSLLDYLNLLVKAT